MTAAVRSNVEAPMTTWDEFATAAPDLAESGRAVLERSGTGEGLLATVRPGSPPRINPVKVGIVDGRLLVYVIVGSGKARDLAEDGRYAVHAHLDPAVPNEFLVRGRAVEVRDASLRAAAAAAWPFEIDDGYALYDLSIDHALLGERRSADEWPPTYTSWKPTASA
jgi:hypothetical protein